MHRAIAWDVNTRPDPQDLNQALKPFGLHVYQDPTFAQTSYTSFLISDRELTRLKSSKSYPRISGTPELPNL